MANAPFNHADPQDIVADMFRKQVTQLLLDADKVTLYRELPPEHQLECFIAGALTGIVGAAFACISSDGYDYVMEHIAGCLPFARQQAENVGAADGAVLGNDHDTPQLPPQTRDGAAR